MKELLEKISISKRFNPHDFKLCYVADGFAYFTTKNINEQRGDDWNDVPYEHNAGTPYHPSRPDLPNRMERFPDDWNTDGTPKWEIVKIGFEADLNEPSENHYNSPYSVEMINNGAVAWLYSSNWSNRKISIHAGTTIPDFIEKIMSVGGEVYLPIKWLV